MNLFNEARLIKNMKPSILFLLIIHFFNQNVFSQNYDKNYFRSPVNIQIRLSGNFGEIRPNHFHSGIDIKVPYLGVKLYAAADGYISRIKKSSGGYGNALYITHPNGLKTVYAHLQKFNERFEKYSENIQYSLNSFEFTHYPDSSELKVKKGDLIGYVGNTGRSYGPHLHFEIREAEKDIPINPQYFNFEIADNIKPRIYELIAYPIGEGSRINGSNKKQKFKVYKGKYGYYIKNTIHYSGSIAFSINAYDYMNNVRNTQGIYSLSTELDTNIIYHHKLDRISFYDTRYINSMIDYAEKKLSGKIFQKCYIDPGNKLNIYNRAYGNGVIKYTNDGIQKIKITSTDYNQNSSYLKFKIKGSPAIKEKADKKEQFTHNEDNFFVKENFRALIKKGSLYTNVKVDFKVHQRKSQYYSEIFEFNSYLIPIHEYIHVAINCKDVPKNLISKALIVYIDQKGKMNSLGGHYLNGFMAARTNEFGKFAIAIDTIGPQIIDVEIKRKDYSDLKQISFLISDNLAGIEKYHAEIDGKNIIFEYDEKNNRIKYVFDNHISKNKMHTLKLEVFDKKNNKTLAEKEFFK